MRRGKQAGSRRENGFPSGVMHLCFPERNTESPLPPVSLSLLFFPKRVSLPFPLFLPLPSSTGYIRSRMGKAIESILSASNRLFDQPSCGNLHFSAFHSLFLLLLLFFLLFPSGEEDFRVGERKRERDISRCVALANEEIILIGGGFN